MTAKQEALETAMRRNLGFHLGAHRADEEQERELLVSALLDAAEAGALPDVAAVEQVFVDYLPDTSLSSSDRQELYDDVLRDTLKHFPSGPSEDEDGKEDSGSGSETEPPGCCVLCERLMPLTRHHVMPRSTHKRYRKKGYADAVLNRTINICRPCHSAVHRAHDASTLSERFTTPEELLQDESVGRFVAWARKQRTTSTEDANNNLLHYRR